MKKFTISIQRRSCSTLFNPKRHGKISSNLLYDHHTELEKWQLYYQERSRIRIIEWLRNNHFHFVFEEDLEMTKSLIEKLKKELFVAKASKDVLAARKVLAMKAKSYYSNEALNPRPKRGRPPKQAAKLEIEHQVSTDIYTTVPSDARLFLFTPDYTSSSSVTRVSSKFDSEEELMASRRAHSPISSDMSLESINQKLANLRSLSSRWLDHEPKKKPLDEESSLFEETETEIGFGQEDLEEEEDFVSALHGQPSCQTTKKAPPINGRSPTTRPLKPITAPIPKKKAAPSKSTKPLPKKTVIQKSKPKAPLKKAPLRSILPSKKGGDKNKGKGTKASPLKAPPKKLQLKKMKKK